MKFKLTRTADLKIGGLKARLIFQYSSDGELPVRVLPGIWRSYVRRESSNSGDLPSVICKVRQAEDIWPVKQGKSFITVETDLSSGTIKCRSIFRLNLRIGRGEPSRALLELYPGDPFTSFSHGIRVLYAFLAAWNNGVMLHSAAVRTSDGLAVAFPGRSGAGKSTIARLCSRLHVVGDDLVMVRKGESGFRVWSTPFNNLGSPEDKSGGTPLGAVLFPVHGGPGHYVERISDSEALAMLLSSSPTSVLHEATLERICDFHDDMINSTRIGKLVFEPLNSVAGYLDGYFNGND